MGFAPHPAEPAPDRLVVRATDPARSWSGSGPNQQRAGLQILDEGIEGPAESVRVLCLTNKVWFLAAVGRHEEAQALADEAVAAAERSGNPLHYINALGSCHGSAFAWTDPPRARRALHQAVIHSREHRLPAGELAFTQELAVLEINHGDQAAGLALMDTALNNSQRAGQVHDLGLALASLAMTFSRLGEAETAATLYGASTRIHAEPLVAGVTSAMGQLQDALGDDAYRQHLSNGAALETGDAVAYARDHIRQTLARQ